MYCWCRSKAVIPAEPSACCRRCSWATASRRAAMRASSTTAPKHAKAQLRLRAALEHRYAHPPRVIAHRREHVTWAPPVPRACAAALDAAPDRVGAVNLRLAFQRGGPRHARPVPRADQTSAAGGCAASSWRAPPARARAADATCGARCVRHRAARRGRVRGHPEPMVQNRVRCDIVVILYEASPGAVAPSDGRGGGGRGTAGAKRGSSADRPLPAFRLGTGAARVRVRLRVSVPRPRRAPSLGAHPPGDDARRDD
eukprot:scaffold2727_cov385-Prasinococcus_capsulatus_cf.AAC.3